MVERQHSLHQSPIRRRAGLAFASGVGGGDDDLERSLRHAGEGGFAFGNQFRGELDGRGRGS